MTLIVDNPCDVSDRQLLELYLGGRDEGAFASLVSRHGGTVWGVCRRMLHNEQDVEDAFQAVFATLAHAAAAIRQREAIGCWLYGVAYRTALKARLATVRGRTRTPGGCDCAGGPPWAWPHVVICSAFLMRKCSLEKNTAPPLCFAVSKAKSKAEAACELLERGPFPDDWRMRKLYQSRLARGISLTAIMAALALLPQSAAAAPESWSRPRSIR